MLPCHVTLRYPTHATKFVLGAVQFASRLPQPAASQTDERTSTGRPKRRLKVFLMFMGYPCRVEKTGLCSRISGALTMTP